MIFLKDLFQYPSDPNFDELGSLEITDAFVDENNQIVEKAWNIVKSRIRYKLDDYGLIPKMLGSCNPAKGWIYSRFYKPSREGSLDKDKQFIQALVTDNPDISVHYRNNLLGLDQASKERLLYGNWEFDNDKSTLIRYDKIVDLFSNSFVSGSDNFITCDVARFGSDTTVIAIWNGLRCTIFQYKGFSVTAVADKIKELQVIHKVANSSTLVDEDGVGGGVMDILKCKGFVNNSRPLDNPITKKPENYSNLKSQCYFMLADKVNKGEIYIECRDVSMREMIIQELEQVKQHNMDKDGKKQIVPKDRVKELIGRSPDFSDALMMRMYFELKPKRTWTTV